MLVQVVAVRCYHIGMFQIYALLGLPGGQAGSVITFCNYKSVACAGAPKRFWEVERILTLNTSRKPHACQFIPAVQVLVVVLSKAEREASRLVVKQTSGARALRPWGLSC